MKTEYSNLHNIKDICNVLGIGRTTAYKLLRNEIPAFKIGNKWKCHQKDLENYINQKRIIKSKK